MKLNQNGTATIDLGGTEVTLRSPTYGELKTLRASRLTINQTIQDQMTEIETSLTKKQLEMLRAAQRSSRGKATEEDVKLWDSPREADKEAVSAALVKIRDLPDKVADDVANWWSDTIAMLGDVPRPDINGLPAGLINFESIALWVEHVETTPFLSGPQ